MSIDNVYVLWDKLSGDIFGDTLYGSQSAALERWPAFKDDTPGIIPITLKEALVNIRNQRKVVIVENPYPSSITPEVYGPHGA